MKFNKLPTFPIVHQMCHLYITEYCFKLEGSTNSILHPSQVSSQHPYAEQYIGRPHVMTVDYNNSQEFDSAIREIMSTKVQLFHYVFLDSLVSLAVTKHTMLPLGRTAQPYNI